MTDAKSPKTFLFIGVTTAQSSSMKAFPLWMALLGRPDVQIEGADFVLNDQPERYRAVLERIKEDKRILGALVTSHKISLIDAGRDLFDNLTPFADLLGEVSCIYKRNGMLIGETTDPSAGGAALFDHIGASYFASTGGHVLFLGAGGAATGLTLHLLSKDNPADRPQRIVLVDKSEERIRRLEGLLARVNSSVEIQYVVNDGIEQNDAAVAAVPEGSVVVNATGMGKDSPGSPVSDNVRFPRGARVWELNYRGERRFLLQARAQADLRQLDVFDGWGYFVHGWSSIISQVLDIRIDAATREEMGRIARAVR